MSFKDYVKKKKHQINKYMIQKDLEREKKEEQYTVKLKAEAERAKGKMSVYKEREHYTKQIDQYKQARAKSRGPGVLSGIASGMRKTSDFARTLEISKPPKSSGGGMFGGSSPVGGSNDIFGSMFGPSSKPKQTKRRTKRRKSRSKSKSKRRKSVTIQFN